MQPGEHVSPVEVAAGHDLHGAGACAGAESRKKNSTPAVADNLKRRTKAKSVHNLEGQPLDSEISNIKTGRHPRQADRQETRKQDSQMEGQPETSTLRTGKQVLRASSD